MKKKTIFVVTLPILLLFAAQLAIGQTETEEVKQTAKQYFFGKLSDMVSGASTRLKPENLKHLELSLIEEDWVMGGRATGVIGMNETDSTATFTQISLTRIDKRTTGNIGIGHRFIPQKMDAIIGTNLFLDNEFSGGHQRIGIGLEFLTVTGGVRFNHYKGTSGEKKYKGVREKALDGSDLQLSYRFDGKFEPEIFYRGFEWKGDSDYKVKGREAGALVNLNENLVLRLSNKDDDKSLSENKAELRFVMKFGAKSSKMSARSLNEGNQRYALKQMLFEPVQRENTIRKSQIKLGIVMSSY